MSSVVVIEGFLTSPHIQNQIQQQQQHHQPRLRHIDHGHPNFLSSCGSRGTTGSFIIRATNDDENDDDDWNVSQNFDDIMKDAESIANIGGGGGVGPEQSQMNNFIADFLKRENNDNIKDDDDTTTTTTTTTTTASNNKRDKFTHLIAIPMGSCDELAIELESVQRAIIYHCPVLVHTCLVPSIMRLPLLYVDAPSTTVEEEVTESLHHIVQNVVQQHIFVSAAQSESTTESNDINRNDDDVPLDGVNNDGIKPLTLTFQSLEVDGHNNQALHTVALPDDPGTVRLQNFVTELQKAIAELHPEWETQIPPDEHIVNTPVPDTAGADGNGNGGGGRSVPPVFRPRVPFMRIPPNYQDFLEPLPEGGEELFRSADQGGNGISPIFWSTWWDDVFGMARLREIGIYPRTPTDLTTSFMSSLMPSSSSSSVDEEEEEKKSSLFSLAENAFYMPHKLTPLPDGNAALAKEEAKFETYQEQRIKQAEYDAQQDQEQKRGLAESQNSPDDVMLEKTQERLKTLYRYDIQEMEEAGLFNVDTGKEKLEDIVKAEADPARPKIDTTLLDEWTQERIKKANAAKGITMYDDEEEDEEESSNVVDAITQGLEEAEEPKAITTSTEESKSNKDEEDNDNISITSFDDANDQLDEWTKNRIRQKVDSLEYRKARESLAIKKDKVPFKDNPILKAYKEGTLAPQSQQSKDSSSTKALPPFPARESFVGFWQVLNSPTGFAPDDDGGDGSKSENLILRVDGTTAGGPILDPQTQQKAAGGTWKVTPNDDNNGKDAQLRIRLVIPPKKERILVLQGTATQAPQLSLNNLPPRASSTFGIPELEEKVKRAREAEKRELSDLLDDSRIRCSGKVWLEDAITGKNKMEIGEFSLLKLDTPTDRSQYTITIPKPIKNQD